MSTRDQLQELRELGLRATLFRAQWELSTRVVLPRRAEARAREAARESREPSEARARPDVRWTSRLPFADPVVVAEAMRDRMPRASSARLLDVAEDAARGKILCFGRWIGDYGDPIDWHLNPKTRERWTADRFWSVALGEEARVGDVKLSWEVARFPHAYHLARAAAFHPEHADRFASVLAAQIEHFVAANPPERGIHWNSGQEIALRLMAWVFALDTLLVRREGGSRAAEVIARAIHAGTTHIENVISYAQRAVYNNHLLSEALGLYLAGTLLPTVPEAARWRTMGRAILEEEATRQFYPDGAYIQLSHNYHRVALHVLGWACLVARAAGDRPASSWTRAMERSLDFLVAHQNPVDGRLPNYGANDGSLPSILSTCDHSDFRPLLQGMSLFTRGERLYEPGPWDEAAAWLLGPRALDAPLRAPERRSVSFTGTGFHVLRADDERSFVTFRCGTIRDRFSQIDMLHVDVWWRGQNVLVDGGSYLYNGPPEWHEHFMRTRSHNTVTIDGRDQMVHYRKFKFLYPVEARVLELSAHAVAGEHDGYRRYDPSCVHRRAVRLVGDDLVIVVDHVPSTTAHAVRLQWLGGAFAYRHENGSASMVLDTPEGPYAVAVFDERAEAQRGSVVAGQESPPRGWLSRYYAEKVAAPSLEVNTSKSGPHTLVTVMGPGRAELTREGDLLTARCEGASATFRLHEGLIVIDQEARA